MDSPTSNASSPAPAERRRSGRVTKKPQHLGDHLGVPAKRKRGAHEDVDDDDVEMRDEDSDEDDEDDEGELDDEEVESRTRRTRKATSGKSRAIKKPKQNGEGVNLAIRSASGAKSSKPRAKRAVRFSEAEAAGGLYADVFGRGSPLDDVAAQWIGRFKRSEKESVADFFTFLFKCAGCDHKVDVQSLEDPDSFSSQIDDIQQTYQAQNITEYPLISRSKGTAAFKQTFTGFIHSLMLTIAKSNVLYENTVVMEVITSWISVMSATPNRPFRHTATVAALTIVSALCGVGRDLADVNSKLMRQVDGEKKKSRGANKARIAEMEKNVKQNTQKEQILKEQLDLWFDAVFVHRYRDVDHHIRLDCMQALGDWIFIFPDVYFDGTFLRYFGWVLSDLNAATRLEVLKGLIRLYKDSDKLHGLRAFTERFRPRMVEMATRDSDPHVRTTAIELIDVLREAGFLEPSDIDAVGKLIFDSEPRVRKSVVNFFAQNVDDAYESRIEDLGGLESVEDVFGSRDANDDDYDSLRPEWLKLKCLVEVLASYDAQDELDANEMIPIPETDSYIYVRGLESRFSVAAEGLCDRIPELKWEILAGYLLYDHSQTIATNGVSAGSDAMDVFKREVKLSDKEEILLLEVLNAAVKLDLAQSAPHDKPKKMTKSQRLAEEDAMEEGARHLANLIPRLLNKFGALPEAASAILRLEHAIRPETQDVSAYNTLLDDVKKQFLTHANPSVLQEASKALLHARAGEAEESAHVQVTSLAEDAVQKIANLTKSKNANARGRNLGARGNLDEDRLNILHGSVLRLEMLGSIEDICNLLETPLSDNRNNPQAPLVPVEMLLHILQRGLRPEQLADEVETQEDSVVLRTARALSFYFMWKIRAVGRLISSTGFVPPAILRKLQERKEKFAQAITNVLSARSGSEEIRLVLAVVLIDMFVAFAGLVHIKPSKRIGRQGDGGNNAVDSNKARPYLALVSEVPKETQTLLLQILSAAEKAYAKRTKRTLEDPDEAEEPGIEDDPEDDEDEDEDMDEIVDEAGKDVKLAADLVAEQRLCDLASGLVLGIWAAILDGKTETGGNNMVRKRLRRNRAKLGHNYKSCIEALDKGGPLTAKGGKKSALKKIAADRGQITVESDEDEEEQAEGGEDAAAEEEIREDSPENVEEERPVENILGD